MAGEDKQAKGHHIDELEIGPMAVHYTVLLSPTGHSTSLSSRCPLAKGQAHERMIPAPVPRLGPSLRVLF